MDLSPVVDWPCAMNILGFTLGTVLEMRGSTLGVFPEQCNLEKMCQSKLLESYLNLLFILANTFKNNSLQERTLILI